jgi:hypothetical protein
MDRKISLSDGKYEVKHDGRGLEFWRNGEAWPAAEEYRFANVIASMYHRIIELEDRLELADRQYAGVVLALMEAGKATQARPCPHCGWTTACDTKVEHPPELKPEYEHHADGKVSFINYEAMSQASIRAQDRHAKALADAVWVFRKEGALCSWQGKSTERVLEQAIKAYLQHGVAK